MKIPKRSLLVFFVATIAITACREPQANFTSDKASVLVRENINFSNSTIHGDYYKWDFGDSLYSEEENPVHKYVDEGIYAVTLTAYSKNKKKYDYATKTINVTRNSEIIYNTIIYPLSKGYVYSYGNWDETGAYNFVVLIFDDRMTLTDTGLIGTGNFIYLELWSLFPSEIYSDHYSYSGTGHSSTYSAWLFGFNCNLETYEGELYEIRGTEIRVAKTDNEYTIRGSISIAIAWFSFYYRGVLIPANKSVNSLIKERMLKKKNRINVSLND